MELVQENDSVLAGVTEAGQGSNGGYGHVSRGTLGTRRWGNGVLPTNTGIVACAVRDAGLGASPGVVGVIRCGPSDRGRAFPWSAPHASALRGGEWRVPAAAPAAIRTARMTLADGPRTHGGSLNSRLVLSRDLNIALHAGQERTPTSCCYSSGCAEAARAAVSGAQYTLPSALAGPPAGHDSHPRIGRHHPPLTARSAPSGLFRHF